MSELTLARAKKGDPKAFEELILPYEKLVLNISYKYMGNMEDARDVAQEAILKVYRNIKTCQTMSSFKAWICKITTNAAIDACRKRKVIFEDLSENLSSQDAGPEEEVLRMDERAQLMKALGSLPEDAKALIILRDMQGLSYEEISEALNCPMGTVSSKLSRARKQMRKALGKFEEER
jgi:RNA polymerase sigma-70 factor (ECF subfamily)